MIKEFLAYRENKKIIKRELANIATTTLPLISKALQNNADIAKTLLNLIDSVKDMSGEELRTEFIKGLAEVIHEGNK